jgi:hypothetical protein
MNDRSYVYKIWYVGATYSFSHMAQAKMCMNQQFQTRRRCEFYGYVILIHVDQICAKYVFPNNGDDDNDNTNNNNNNNNVQNIYNYKKYKIDWTETPCYENIRACPWANLNFSGRLKINYLRHLGHDRFIANIFLFIITTSQSFDVVEPVLLRASLNRIRITI